MDVLQKFLLGVTVKYIIPRLAGQGDAVNTTLNEKDMALLNIKRKKGSVTVILGTREMGKSELAYRWAEVLDRRTYGVSPEQKPPGWIERITLSDIKEKVKPWSTIIFDDLPAYAGNRDYNNSLVQELEQLIPLCRHEKCLHLIFNSQSSAQADKYILDCDLAFFKPLGILMDDVERPNIRRIYRNEVNPFFDGRSEWFIKRHAWMRSRSFIGGISVAKVPRTKTLEGGAVVLEPDEEESEEPGQ